MIKVQIGETIFSCDTAKEAIEIHRLAQQAQESSTNHGRPRLSRPLSPAIPQPELDELKAFMEKLLPLRGEEVTAEELAKALGAEHSRGLGPLMAKIDRTVKKVPLDLERSDIVVRFARPEGTMWKIKNFTMP